jgi:hypothetical protein
MTRNVLQFEVYKISILNSIDFNTEFRCVFIGGLLE